MLEREKKNAMQTYSSKEMKKCEDFAKGYIDFLSNAKTEREFVRDSVKRAEAKGFKNINSVKELKAGDKVYAVNMDKNIFLFVIGKEPMANGMNLLGAHIDSPRIDLKPNPLYETNELAMFKTHYYGGIKKYQWVAMPLALHGVIFKQDGTRVDIVFGEDENEPVLGISDLLPHLGKDQMAQTMREGVKGEDLNVLIGTAVAGKKDDKDRVKKNILELLNKKYDITEEDFNSAELQIVPAGRARSYGLDGSMIMAYGHDDKVCAYTSLEAILEVENPNRTLGCILCDKEEVGSIGATGMHSQYFEYVIEDMVEMMGGSGRDYRQCMLNTKMLSSDVSVAFDPNWASVTEANNTAYFNHGVVFSKYTGSGGKGGCNDANPEFIAQLRNVMNNNNILWQIAELGKVDQGGGGTIAYIMAQLGMNVIDCGVAVQNMHAPWEVVTKADVYETYNAYIAFLKDIK